MATGPVVNQGKTEFVRDFLTSHRDAYHEAVNRAWAEAGNAGSVSESLVGKMRRKLGLTGQKATKDWDAAPAAKSSPRATRTKAASRTQESPSPQEGQKDDTGPSKSDFIREVLQREPGANVKAVNRAWASAGHEGKISDTIFYNTKKELRGGANPTSAAPTTPKVKSAKGPKARPAKEARPEPVAVTAPSKPVAGSKAKDRERTLDRVEDAIDDLIFELKQLGGMEDALEALRKVRRAVVRSHQG